MGRRNQYIQLVKVLHCKLPTKGKQLPDLALEVGPGGERITTVAANLMKRTQVKV